MPSVESSNSTTETHLLYNSTMNDVFYETLQKKGSEHCIAKQISSMSVIFPLSGPSRVILVVLGLLCTDCHRSFKTELDEKQSKHDKRYDLSGF